MSKNEIKKQEDEKIEGQMDITDVPTQDGSTLEIDAKDIKNIEAVDEVPADAELVDGEVVITGESAELDAILDEIGTTKEEELSNETKESLIDVPTDGEVEVKPVREPCCHGISLEDQPDCPSFFVSKAKVLTAIDNIMAKYKGKVVLSMKEEVTSIINAIKAVVNE